MFDYKKFCKLLSEKKLTARKIVEMLEKMEIKTSESSIKGYKAGNHSPRLEILCAFSKILEVKIDELVKCQS